MKNYFKMLWRFTKLWITKSRKSPVVIAYIELTTLAEYRAAEAELAADIQRAFTPSKKSDVVN